MGPRPEVSPPAPEGAPPGAPPGDLRVVYEREFAYVWHNLRRLGIPERDLPDVTHDVFVTVWRRLDSYDRARPFRPWLFGVLFRVASDNLRLSRHSREILSDEDLDLPDPAPPPDERVHARDVLRVVEEALGALDLRHRVVLVMHDFSHHEVADIADTLAIPLKTAYTRLRVARERFTVAARQAKQRRGLT